MTIFAVSAAYAFARFRFPGRKWGLIRLYRRADAAAGGDARSPLRALEQHQDSGHGRERALDAVRRGIAYVSGALPFAIWNLRGYIDTIPSDLEEAAMVEGAGPNRAFIDIILPLMMPAIAITILFGFMAAWTEFVLAWTFLTDPNRFTLAMGLYSMAGSIPPDALVRLRRDGDFDHHSRSSCSSSSCNAGSFRSRGRRGQGMNRSRTTR